MAGAKASPKDSLQEPSSLIKIATKLYRKRKTPQYKSPKDAITVVCISDTHNQQVELPDGDLLVHAGDLSKSGTFAELQAQLDWLDSQDHKHKVVIGGNHDRLLDVTFSERHPGVLPLNSKFGDLNWGSLIYLHNSSAKLEFTNGRMLNLYGSPYVPSCGQWAFTHPSDTDIWNEKIPIDTDIVVTHGPPKWHLDHTMRGAHDGCPHLLRELKRVRPKLVICGHIHEGHGEEKVIFDEVDGIWERIMETNGSARGLLRLALRICWWNISKVAHRKGCRYTHLINASILEGGRVPERRVVYDPVVYLI